MTGVRLIFAILAVLLLLLGLYHAFWPGPQPTPAYPGSWVLIVEESGQRAPATRHILADVEYFKTLVDRGLKWRVYDDDSPDALKFANVLRNAPLPVLMILSPSGQVLALEPLPETVQGVERIVRTATGL